jgi:carbon storage regulator CsrA
MLVLTRKTDEVIHVGENIRISVLAIRGGSVRLGFEAPRNVRILRAELKTRSPSAVVEDVPAHADYVEDALHKSSVLTI